MSEETNLTPAEDPKDPKESGEEVSAPDDEYYTAPESEHSLEERKPEDGADGEGEASPKKEKKISFTAFALSSVALILAAVMLTYTFCSLIYRTKLIDATLSEGGSGNHINSNSEYFGFELFQSFIDSYSFGEVDKDEMIAAALKAYVAATGDPYAEYYTAEEYAALQASTAGSSEGIGINVINTTALIGGVEWKTIRVINVMKDSPAQKYGVKVGDHIVAAGLGESAEYVQDIGYDGALSRLQGSAGTVAEFVVYREVEADLLEFSIPRGKVTTSSVYHRVHATDPSVGIIKISQFDLTAPGQFCEAMDDLIAKGCTKFVFDVRYNPGGDLMSIQAVLSYFLEEGDVVIRTKDAEGNTSQSVVTPIAELGSYAACNVSRADIGKYRQIGGKPLEAVVLCNGSTASAAELFVATFRDYGLATTVGTTTFGKGSMQTIWNLAYKGYEGALKLTTAKYFSAKDEKGYDGVGIAPDVYEELSEEAAGYNVYELPDTKDNQLARAVAQFQ